MNALINTLFEHGIKFDFEENGHTQIESEKTRRKTYIFNIFFFKEIKENKLDILGLHPDSLNDEDFLIFFPSLVWRTMSMIRLANS